MKILRIFSHWLSIACIITEEIENEKKQSHSNPIFHGSSVGKNRSKKETSFVCELIKYPTKSSFFNTTSIVLKTRRHLGQWTSLSICAYSPTTLTSEEGWCNSRLEESWGRPDQSMSTLTFGLIRVDRCRLLGWSTLNLVKQWL